MGIIITLIYLATQIRQTNKALSSTTRNAWRDAVQVTNQINISTPENSEIWYRGVSLRENLEGKDFGIFQVQVSAALNAFENVYLDYLDGIVDEGYWEAKSRTIQFVLTTPSGRAVWDIWNDAHIGDPRFEKFINEQIITNPYEPSVRMS